LDFLKNVLGNNFKLIEELQRYYRELLYAFHSVSPHINILHFHRTIIKTK